MNILRLLLLFFVGLFIRRLFRKPAKSQRTQSRQSHSFGSAEKQKRADNNTQALGDITEQEIDDADFEEIP